MAHKRRKANASPGILCMRRCLCHMVGTAPSARKTTVLLRWAASRHLGVLRVPSPCAERAAAGHPPTRVRPLVDGPSCLWTEIIGCYSASAQGKRLPRCASQLAYYTTLQRRWLGKSVRLCGNLVGVRPRVLERNSHAVVVPEVVAPDDLSAGVATLAGSDGREEQSQRLRRRQGLLGCCAHSASRDVQHAKSNDAPGVAGHGVAQNRLNRNADDGPPELPPVRLGTSCLAHGLFPRIKAGACRAAGAAPKRRVEPRSQRPHCFGH